MKFTLLCALAWSLPLVCPAGSRHDGDWQIRDRETIQKTLSLNQQPMRLVVDNIDGYIHVSGVSGSQVRITAHKTIRADTDADLQQARSEVKLNITEKPGTASVYFEAPWRCDGRDSGCHDNARRFYNVTYDIDVEAPAAARLYVSGVNNGEIQIENIAGDYEVRGVNGGIQMSGIAGSGSAHTVNGPVSVRYSKNPASACSYTSVNGQLDVWLQPQFSADLLFKTFNGQVYSDFDISARPIPVSATSERRNGMFIYHSNGRSGGRAGSGGPELSFDTLNGNVRLHRSH